jgi:hypothetical protein
MMNFTDLPDEVITGRLMAIVKDERKSIVEFLECLAEVERRRTHLALGFSSMFAYLADHLRLSNGCAFRRSKAARLMARFPIIADYLRDGRLSRKKLVELREVLDEEHVVAILDRAVSMTEEQVKELVVELRPKEAPANLLRKLPTPRNDSSRSPVETAQARLPQGRPPEMQAPPPPPSNPSVDAAPARVPATSPGRVEPIAPGLHVLRVTVDGAFVADLQAVRDALSHKMPGAGLEAVLHECIRATLKQIEKRRQGAGSKEVVETPPPGTTYVPAPVRKEVWRRDGGRCTFVSTDGQRCGSRHQLEFHHLLAVANGGLSTVKNVCLRCRAHNRYAAEQDFGVAHVARKIASRREARAGATGAGAAPASGTTIGMPWS